MSRKFGKIAQIGYVVRDIDAAMDNWIEHGVGPWFYVDCVQYKDFLDSGREGMQHIAYWSNDFQKLYDDAVAAGYMIGHEGSLGASKADSPTSTPSTNRAPSSRSPISAVPKANSSSTSARSPRTGTAANRSAGGIESHEIPCLSRYRRIAPAPQGHPRHARPGRRLQDGHALTRSGARVLRDGRPDFPSQFATVAAARTGNPAGRIPL